jgi:aldehyde dehydrogenase (NAD+)
MQDFWFPTGVTQVDGRAVMDLVFAHDGQSWARLVCSSLADVDAAVARAQAAMDGPWRRSNGVARADLMRRLAARCREEVDSLGLMETLQTGKVIRETRAQCESLARWLDHFAGVAELVEGRVVPTGKEGVFAYTVREPVGVVACVIPWNSPIGILAYKLAPLLAAGCAAVVKPSEYAPASIVRVAALMREVGFPEGVLEVVTGGADVARRLVEHPAIDKISFTGGDQVGRLVAHAAADKLIPTTMELGGKSAHVVLPDADLDLAANGIAAGIFAAAGQTCVAGSRVIVHEAVHGALVSRVRAIAERLRMGDPRDPDTEIGPLAHRAQFERVRDLVAQAVEDGNTLAWGGEPVPALGPCYLRPAIFDHVDPSSRLAQEEAFGPVLAITSYSDGQDPYALANGTRFGLAAALWTRDVFRAFEGAGRLEAGMVWVNGYRMVAPAAPFGGIKASGHGRENGLEGLESFLRTKMIWMSTSDTVRDPFRVG